MEILAAFVSPRRSSTNATYKEMVELETHNGCLTIRPVDTPREGWDEAFRQMAEAGDDTLLDQDTLPLSEWDETEWDETEWEW